MKRKNITVLTLNRMFKVGKNGYLIRFIPRKKFLFTWFFKNKKFIFATMLTTTTLLPTNTVYGYTQVDTGKSVIKTNSEIIPDSIESASEDEITINNFLRQKISSLSGIKIPNTTPQNDIVTMYEEAIKNTIPVRIFFRTIFSESEFKATARNRHSGANGYMQLTPATYKNYRRKLGLEKNPTSNIKIGAFYMKELFDFWKRKYDNEDRCWKLTIASYKDGITAIKRNKNLKPKTKRYVNFILK